MPFIPCCSWLQEVFVVSLWLLCFPVHLWIYMMQIVICKNQLLVLKMTGQNSKPCALIFRCVIVFYWGVCPRRWSFLSMHGHDRFQVINEVGLTLSPPRVSLWRVKSSGVRQSKIYKWPLVVKGLKDIILDGNKFSSQTTGCYSFIKVF